MEAGVSLNKAKYGWSKYGGRRHGLVKHKGEWFCQACSVVHPDSIPAYMFSADNGEYRDFIRICAPCENLVKKFGIKTLEELFEKVRSKRD